MTNLAEVLEDQVKDVYNSENQIAKALPKMAKKASTPQLKEAFLTHLAQTKVHIERIKEVAAMLGIKPGGKECKATTGLVAEGAEVIEEEGMNGAIDAALIGAAQRVEHYEMAAYGCMIALANATGQTKVVKTLQMTLAEEKKTDELLTQCAEKYIYPNTPKNEDEAPKEEEEPLLKKVAKKLMPKK